MNKLLLLVVLLSIIAGCSEVQYIDKRHEKSQPSVAAGVIPHKLIRGAAPDYSIDLKDRGVEGFVMLLLDVSKEGTAENVQVLASRPEGIFEEAALDAAGKWKYQPAEKDGQIVTVRNIPTFLSFCAQIPNGIYEKPDPICRDASAKKQVVDSITVPNVVLEP